MPLQPLITSSLVQLNSGTSAPFIVGPAWLSGGPIPTFPLADKTVGVAGTIISGSPTWTVQVTCNQDPINTENWVDHAVLVNQALSAYSDISSPVTGIRLVVSGTGQVNLDVCRWA